MAEQTANEDGVKVLELDGYKFEVDTDLLDDVDAFGLINKIENQNQITAVVPLMLFLIGTEEWDKMRKHFIELDAKAHPEKRSNGKPYKPRMRMEKLGEIYQTIIKNFDPKG